MRGPCLLLVAAVLAALAARTDALTAFGKSQSSTPEKTQTTKPKGRMCTAMADCAGTAGTTCMLDKADGKKHCLCRDGSAPVNSKCTSQPAIPGKPCSSHSDCILNAECIANDTAKKTCTCREGYEYQPSVDDSLCNGCGAALPWLVTLLAALLVLALTDRRSSASSWS